jgi:biopolymer transport protein ExbD
MAGFSSNKPSAPITGINVTPLVDITLVLLIIFMVTAKLVVSRAVPMDLPKAATSGEVQEIFSVSLSAAGERQVNGADASTDAALLELAKKALKNNAELRAVVSADGTVPHSRVMGALDVLRQAGLSVWRSRWCPVRPSRRPQRQGRGSKRCRMRS